MPRIQNIFLGILAVIAILAVIGFCMWGAIQVAQKIPSMFSSLASVSSSGTTQSASSSSKNETIVLSTQSTTVNARTTFTLSWTHANKAVNGSYTFRYDCANGVFFITPTPPSGAPVPVYCNVPFNFLNTNNSIVLTPIAAASTTVPITAYIDFTPNGASKPSISGSMLLSVTNIGGSSFATTTPSSNTTAPAHTTKPTNGTYPTTSTTKVSDPNGYVDLQVTFLQMGYLDRATNAFIPTNTPSRSQKVAFRFSIENIGTKTSPEFDFNAVLPTSPISNAGSPAEQALTPGGRIEFTMGFEGATMSSGNSVVTIQVDPSNRISESNKTNNTASYVITTTP